MKKLLILLLLFSACSTTEDSPEQKWIDSVYNQGWYTPDSDHFVPFQPNGSITMEFFPWKVWNDDDREYYALECLPLQNNTKYTLDEVINDTHAYYRFNYMFKGENLTLYYEMFHGYLDATGESGIFWAVPSNYEHPPIKPAPDNERKEWLIKTFAKGNFSTRGYALGLKKSSRSTTVENNIPNNSNAPTSDNASGAINN